jgi:uncharacterized protein YndB with AHSA1/START domain
MTRSERDGQPMRVVIASRTYDTSLDDLWDALTNVTRISSWFLPVTGRMRVGGRYRFAGHARGHIVRYEPPHVLGVTWELEGSVSWVTVTLAPNSKDVTTLELEHVTPARDHWKQLGAGSAGVGWDGAMSNLARHIAGGPRIVRTDAAA